MNLNQNGNGQNGAKCQEIAVTGMAIRTARFSNVRGFWDVLLDPGTPVPQLATGPYNASEDLKSVALADSGWSNFRNIASLDLHPNNFLSGIVSAFGNSNADLTSGILCGCQDGDAGGYFALKDRRRAEQDHDTIYCTLSFEPIAHLSRCAMAEICAESSPDGIRERLEPLFTGNRDLPHCRIGAPAQGEPLRQFQAVLTAVLATHLKTIPPGRFGEGLAPCGKSPFYSSDAPRPWIHGDPEPRQAVVIGPGSGGPWAALTIKEYTGSHRQPVAKFHSHRPSEVYLLSAGSRERLMAALQAEVTRLEEGVPLSLAKVCLERSKTAPELYRFAAVAYSIKDLAGKLKLAIGLIGTRERSISERQGFYFGKAGHIQGKTVFLFPGFNSEYPGMLGDLCRFFPNAREWFDTLDRHSGGKSLFPSDLVFPPPEGLSVEEREKLAWDLKLGGPAGLVADLAMGEMVDSLGACCDAVAGHSNGENAALIAAGIFQYREKEAVLKMIGRITRHYREGEQRHRQYRGHFLLISGLEEKVLLRLLDAHGGKACVAMENCINQVVVYASESGEDLAAEIRERGGVCILRPTERPYHTPLFESHAALLKEFYRDAEIGSGRRPAYSTATAEPFPTDPGGIRDLALRQWIQPVRFRQTVQRLYDEGFRYFLEIGPDATVTAFVKDSLRGKEHVTIPSNVSYRGGWEQLQHLAARLFVEGKAIRPEFFFEGRSLEPAETRHAPAPETASEAASAGERAGDGNTPLPDSYRRSVLASHFELMQRFLESQQSVVSAVMAALGNGAAIDETAVAAPAELPAAPMMPASRPAPSAVPSTLAREWCLTGDVIERGEGRIYTERIFDARQDTFLLDHALGRKISICHRELIPLPIVPFTVSMTILAEAACRLMEGKRCIALSGIRGSRWLAADRGTFKLGIEAQLTGGTPESDDVRVRLFEIDRDSGKRHLAFEGMAHMAADYPRRPAPMPFDREALRDAQVPTGFFYSYCTYNGPVFQGIRQVLQFDPSAIVADLQVPSIARFRADGADPGFEIPGALLDCTGQLSGYWLVEQGIRDFGIFPFRTARYSQFDTLPPPGARCRTHCAIRREGHIVSCSFDFLDETGKVFAHIEDMELRFYDNPWVRRFFVAHDPEDMFSTPADPGTGDFICRRIDNLPAEFLHQSWNIWSRALAHLILNSSELDAWYRLSDRGATATAELLERLAAKDAVRIWARRELLLELLPADIEVSVREDGTLQARCSLVPETRPIPAVSVCNWGEGAAAVLSVSGEAAGIEFTELQAGQEHGNDLVRSLRSAAAKALGRRPISAADWTVFPAGPNAFRLLCDGATVEAMLLREGETGLVVCRSAVTSTLLFEPLRHSEGLPTHGTYSR